MWAAATSSVSSFPCFGIVVLKNRLNATNSNLKPQSLKIRASFFDYPLATRLMVKNLPYCIDEVRIQEEFSNFGEIAEVMLAKDKITKRSKGFAFVQYTCQDDAMVALENMDQKKFDGRTIYVELAKPGRDSFGGYPRTSGPPKGRPKQEPEDVADCWY